MITQSVELLTNMRYLKLDFRFNYFKDNGKRLTHVKAFAMLRESFQSYVERKVLTKVERKKMWIYYTGAPVEKFRDWKKIVDFVQSGRLMNIVSGMEVNMSLITQRLVPKRLTKCHNLIHKLFLF